MVHDDAARPIRTAIVGYGLSGRVFHSPFVSAVDPYELTAVVTSDPHRQRAAAEEHPTARIYPTYRELWDAERGLDLVVLSSPPGTHLEFARAALERGAAVIVDKPFVPRVADAVALRELAESVGRPLMVFHNRRWDGDFLTVRSLVESGELGEVVSFESSFEHWAPHATDGWKDQLPPEDGGGVAFDLGSHLVDQALQLFGGAAAIRSSIRTVRDGGGNDDHSRIDIRHVGGVESHLLMSRVSRALGPRFRVLGTRGSFVSEVLDGQEPALAAGMSPLDPEFGVTPPAAFGTLEVATASGVNRRRVATERGDYAEFYRRAAYSIQRGAPVPVPLEDAIDVVGVLEQAVLGVPSDWGVVPPTNR